MGKLFCYLPSSQLRLHDQLHIYACFKAFPRDLRVSDEGLQCLLPWGKRPCRIIFEEEYNKTSFLSTTKTTAVLNSFRLLFISYLLIRCGYLSNITSWTKISNS